MLEAIALGLEAIVIRFEEVAADLGKSLWNSSGLVRFRAPVNLETFGPGDGARSLNADRQETHTQQRENRLKHKL